MTKLLPAPPANKEGAPPELLASRLPEIKAPVEKDTLPKAPVTSPIPFKPLTAISSEPLMLKPALLPDKVPPLFVKSTEFLANAAIGSARANRTMNSMRFIKPPESRGERTNRIPKGFTAPEVPNTEHNQPVADEQVIELPPTPAKCPSANSCILE